jgi:hypothetical protein
MNVLGECSWIMFSTEWIGRFLYPPTLVTVTQEVVQLLGVGHSTAAPMPEAQACPIMKAQPCCEYKEEKQETLQDLRPQQSAIINPRKGARHR